MTPQVMEFKDTRKAVYFVGKTLGGASRSAATLGEAALMPLHLVGRAVPGEPPPPTNHKRKVKP